MQNFNLYDIDMRKVQEYLSYYENYYGSDFRSNQGLDEITDMVSFYSCSGTWVDLGGGTSTYIWLPAFNGITEVLSIDKHLESAFVHEIVRYREPSGCYTHILNRYNQTIQEMNAITIDYLQMDLLNRFTSERKFNNVSQFGLLGLCQTKEDYLYSLNRLVKFMCDRSVFFGANWIFSQTYAKIKGYSNSYIDEISFHRIAASNGWRLLHEQKIKITDDPHYDSVLIYAFTV